MSRSENGVALIYYIIIAVSIILIIAAVIMINIANNGNNIEIISGNNNEAIDVEINSIQDFEFAFKESKKINVSMLDDSSKSYDIESLGGDPLIIVNNKKYLLESLLKSKSINIDMIKEKLEKDKEDGKCYFDMYTDGGSKLYVYEKTTIIVTASMSMEKQSIIFGPSGMDVFNTYDMLKNDPYTGSEYEEGMGIAAEVAQIVNDELWIVKGDYYPDTLIKINKKISIDSDIKEGDKVNILFSGKYEEGYSYTMYYTNTYAENPETTIFTIYNDINDANQNDAHFLVKEVLGEKCWLVKDEKSSTKERMIIIDCDYKIQGDTLQKGSRFNVANGNTCMSFNSYLKDVTRIEKAK